MAQSQGFAWLVAKAALLAALAWSPAGAAGPEQVQRGEYLTRAGDCAACHTAPDGKPFAGGLAIVTPFGTIHSTNITPDKETGIGAWSDDAFHAAMHDGLGHGGERLYPAMPYQWYTKVTRQDVDDIRAYLATLAPVQAEPRRNTMVFPFNVRLGLAGWNAAFFKPGEFRPDPARSDELNRGAYLVEGLGHCGDCHTPKDLAKAPIESQSFAGGMIDNWYAPNISSDRAKGIGAWPDERLVQYLKTGSVPGKASVAGPMAQVVHDSLAYMTDADLRAIVAYLKATPPRTDYRDARAEDLVAPHGDAAATYLTNCASCHQQDGRGLQAAIPALDGSDTVRAKGPQNIIRIVLGGHLASDSYAIMPAVGADMTDQQVADAVNYVRNAWSNAAPPTAEAGMVGEIRKQTDSLLNGRGCGNLEARTIAPLDDPGQEIDAILRRITLANMPDSVDLVVARAKQVAPKAAQADLVNSLAQQYCPLVQAVPGGREAAGRALMTRFTQLVYTRIASGQKVGSDIAARR